MEDDTASRFRERARYCREIAAAAGSDIWRRSLLQLAQDLEDEADAIDAEAKED